MKPLSPQAAALTQRLYDLTAVRTASAANRAEVLAILAALHNLREPAVAPYTLSLVSGEDREVARQAAVVLDRAMSAAGPADLLSLDEACRRLGPWDSAWASLAPLGLSRLLVLGATELSSLGAASFHASGYVREAAVARLDTVHGGAELPFLLIRMNDWTTPVAERARRAVERRIVPEYAAAFVRSLPVLLRLGASTRRDHQDLLERVFALLRHPTQRAALAEGFTSGHLATRRTAFRLAREGAGPALAATVQEALANSDPLVRLEAAVYARRRLEGAALRPLVPTLLADPFMRVRREGLEAAVERAESDAEAWLRTGLLDRHRAIRELARFRLRGAGGQADFAEVYRERLHAAREPRDVAVALLGVAETGGPADAEIARAFLRHEAAAVRDAAVRTLGALDLDRAVDDMVGALYDQAPRVSHAARDVLRFRVGVVGPERLREALQTAAHEHSRLDALALALRVSKWDSLLLLIEATADPSERVRTMASVRLRGWVARQNATFARPTERQIEAIHTALASHRFTLDRHAADEAQHALRVWMT